MPHTHETFHRPTANQIINNYDVCFVAVIQADYGRSLSSRLLIHCSHRFYSATCSDRLLNIFCWTSLGIHIVSKIQVVNFRHVAPLCMINLMNTESTNVCRIRWCWRMPKIMNISSGILKIYWYADDVSLQRQWPRFFGPPCTLTSTLTERHSVDWGRHFQARPSPVISRPVSISSFEMYQFQARAVLTSTTHDIGLTRFDCILSLLTAIITSYSKLNKLVTGSIFHGPKIDVTGVGMHSPHSPPWICH